MIAFAARDFPAVKSAADGDFHTLDARLVYFGNLLFDSPSVRHALFKLGSNRLRNKLCVLIDFFNLSDVDYDSLAARELCKVLLYYFDFLTRFTDKHAGTTRIDAYFNLICRSDNGYFAYRRVIILLF